MGIFGFFAGRRVKKRAQMMKTICLKMEKDINVNILLKAGISRNYVNSLEVFLFAMSVVAVLDCLLQGKTSCQDKLFKYIQDILVKAVYKHTLVNLAYDMELPDILKKINHTTRQRFAEYYESFKDDLENSSNNAFMKTTMSFLKHLSTKHITDRKLTELLTNTNILLLEYVEYINRELLKP